MQPEFLASIKMELDQSAGKIIIIGLIHGAIGFGFASHGKNWPEIFLTNQRVEYRNHNQVNSF